ncbi:SoxR reducing system RseC family protein [Bacteroidales bacterium OttesenSCG-928-I21]|nr:SoxR reducing system RseC family protein [Bacteroidales bacterium OttesenSCG-928-I21]
MSKNTMIEHIGVVSEITDDSIFVKLEVQSACASCHAKNVCGADGNTKIVEINSNDKSYRIGENVNVKLRESLGMKALFLGYLLPFIVLISTLIIFINIGISEGLSAVLAILFLIPYYTILYFLKDKLKKEFDFKIEKLINYVNNT